MFPDRRGALKLQTLATKDARGVGRRGAGAEAGKSAARCLIPL